MEVEPIQEVIGLMENWAEAWEQILQSDGESLLALHQCLRLVNRG